MRIRNNILVYTTLAYLSMFFVKCLSRFFIDNIPITKELLYDPAIITFALIVGVVSYFIQKRKKDK